MKKLSIAIIAVLIFVLPITVFAANLPDPPENYAVLDQAGVLSPTTIQYLANSNDDLFYYTGGDVRFLITDFLPMGQEIADYTLEVFNYWGVGSEQNNNGVLVVMSVVEGEYWITVGTGLAQQMSRSYLENVVSTHFSPYFADGNYDMAVRNLFDVLSGRIYELFPPVEGQQAAPNQMPGTINEFAAQGGTNFGIGDVFGFIIFVAIALFIIKALLFPRRGHWGGGMMGGPMMGGGWGWGRRRGFGGMMGGFFGGYLMGRARHRQPGGQQRGNVFNPPQGGAGGSGDGFTRGGASRGGGAGGASRGNTPSRPSGGSPFGGGRSGGFGGGYGGGFTRGGGSRGGGFGGRRR